jgi:hypothetical protein
VILHAVGEPGALRVDCISVEREFEHDSRSPEGYEKSRGAINR